MEKFMGIMDRVDVDERVIGRRWLYTFLKKNDKGELIQVELTKCEPDNRKKKSLPNLWKKYGYMERVIDNYWYITVYATDENGNCYGKYNPMCKNDSLKIDFNWILEATEKNRIKVLEEVERRAFN